MQMLIGWKQIAQYMKCGVRTVQRWEAMGLPIHRPAGKNRGSVMAVPEEIDAWSRSTPVRGEDQLRKLQREVERLKSELQALKSAHGLHSGNGHSTVRSDAVRNRFPNEPAESAAAQLPARTARVEIEVAVPQASRDRIAQPLAPSTVPRPPQRQSERSMTNSPSPDRLFHYIP